MTLLELVVLLLVIGILLWLVNSQLGQFIAPPILKIINVVVIVAVVLWLLSVFFGFRLSSGPTVPTFR